MKGKLITIGVNPVHVPVVAANIGALDQVNVMCYDFDWDSTFAWYVGPLRQNGNPKALSCDWKMAYFTSAGIPASKLGLGMPFYGRKWYGATKAFDPSTFNSGNSVYFRDLVNNASVWQSKYQFYDSTY